MARTIAIGIQNFSELRENRCFYIDKTDFIREWWENMDSVTLITRPRRFGKTLNLSMIEDLCARGGKNVGNLHRDTINMVKASSQAAFVDKLLPLLTEEELAYYRRGKNSHVHAVPKSCTPAEYAKATGLEALFGALYLAGQTERLNELFKTVMEGSNGI